ncbi:MAG: hypothetical protein ABSA93_30820 [Streptosporangiaceae bacterium]
MFFEPLTAEDRAFRLPEAPPWSGPPAAETGAVVPVDLVVARSANVVVRVPTIRAFSIGCMIDVEVASRQGDLPENDWWDLQTGGHAYTLPFQGIGGLPDKLLRLGVRFADETKATTLDETTPRRRSSAADDPPAGPSLSWHPSSSGSRGREGHFSRFGLWLWPLPPAEPFELAVEWPFGGIDLTFTEFDGAAVVAAAGRSARLWPD